MVAQDVRVLFEDCRTDPRLVQTGARKFENERRRVVLGREGRELALEFAAGRPFADDQATAMRSAVERQCEIIGEALVKLGKADEPVAARISEYRRIIAFRNILIHGDAAVDHRLVWDVVTTKVPTPTAEVTALLIDG